MKKMIKFTPALLCAVVACSAALISVQTVEAAPVEITQTQEGSISVIVPEGKTLTYELDGKIVKVAGGSSITLPNAAKNVTFPTGAIVTVKRAAVAKPYTYTVVRDVTLVALNKPELKKNSTAFVNTKTPGVKNNGNGGKKIESAFFNPTTVVGSGTDFN